MKPETLLDYCLNKPGALKAYPFGPETTVVKVGGKMFAFFGGKGSEAWINLKCDPDTATILRTEYKSIAPGYHMDKDHWNTVILDGSIPDDEILMMVDMSYELVLEGLPHHTRTKIMDENT